MNTNIQNYLVDNPSFTTDEFVRMIHEEMPEIGRSTIYYMLGFLCKTGAITRVSRGHFIKTGKNNYSYELSDTAKNISSKIIDSFPLVNFQIWEVYQMNEFVNHLLSRNTIIVEVESMLDESIFNLFFNDFKHVLLNPTIDEYYKYSGEETIIIRKLITEAPSSYGVFKQASLEKILVDLFGRGISGKIISRSEYKDIYEESFEKYNINIAKMFRYARRRGIEGDIKKFIHEETSIELEN